MKLANRLSLAATAVIMSTSLGISYTALNAAEDSEVSRLDAQLTTVAAAASLPGVDILQAASNAAEQSNAGISVAFFTSTGDVTLVNDSSVRFVSLPSASQLEKSLHQSIEVSGEETYLMKSLLYSDSEYVVIATTLNSVIENKAQNSRRFFALTLFASSVGAVVVWWLIRRDVRTMNKLINQANLIAEGSKSVTLAEPHGSAEVVELTQALRAMMQNLTDNQLQMENFLGDSSHELRTPLSVIRGYVELLQGELTEEQKDKAFARLSSEILRMERLISDLLLLSELGGVPLREVSSVDLSSIVDAAVHDMSELQPERPLEYFVDGGIFIRGDETLLQQLISNIFANINRHTQPMDKVRLQLHKAHQEIELVIEDSGPGLSESAYAEGPRYFQRFEKSRSRKSGGSGLGMSIIVAIVGSHGGKTIFSRSELGGLKIRITFPELHEVHH